MARKKRSIPEINAGSMADIAFLLLVFFLVTTQMDSSKGIRVRLPPKLELEQERTIQHKRDVLEVLVNANDQLLVENKITQINELTAITKKHLTNEGVLPNFASSSLKAIVSLQNDRGTHYNRYLQVYNELKRAYNEVREEYAQARFGKAYSALSASDKKTVDDKYPIKISEAEPTGFGEE